MIEIIITSSVLILVLMLLRKLCWGKISRRLQYGLWLLVVIRLLVPASLFTSSLSIMNMVEYAGENVYAQWQTIHNEDEQVQADHSMSKEEDTQMDAEEANNNQQTEDALDEDRGQSGTAVSQESYMWDTESAPSNTIQGGMVLRILFGIYIAGVFIIGGCILLCNLKFHRLLVSDRQLIGREGRLNIYLTSQISSPCLWGVLVPAIYMTPKALLTQERKHHIMLHEMTHYRHMDHIWTVVRTLCIVLYWFHPLVWIAAGLSVEDSELACDEGTFVRLGEENREAYGHTLIEMMTDQRKSRRILYCATGMVNGKKEIKRRITAIASYKKQMIWIVVLVVVFAVLLSAFTASTADQDKPDDVVETQEPLLGSQSQSEPQYQSQPASQPESESQFQPQLAADVLMNEDGSFRLAEYEVDLTGDKVKDKIVFDVLYWTELGADGYIITNEMLWNKLWDGSEVCVKVVEGNADTVQNADTKEVILEEYSFSSAHAGNGNLAVINYEGKKCILCYANLMYQGGGGFGYKVWQIMPAGEEPVLLEEMQASYMAPGNGENKQEEIDQVLLLADRLDDFLSAYNTEILLNASTDSEECYMYGSEKGLLNGVRRQNAFEVFMAAVGGSGLELRIEDYFYPDGMEPLTKLPKDAEERILNGEIIYMEVSQDNATAGRLDLNGDGEKEVLYLEIIGNDSFRIRVNDQYYDERYSENVEPMLMAFSPDGKQILLAVYEDGPSNDPMTVFYRYDDTGVHPAGKILDDLREATIGADGSIQCTFRADMLQTEWAWGYYYWNGSEIVRREDDIYYFVDDSKWREESRMPLVLLREITVFSERSEDSQAIAMKPQKVRNAATDNSEWIFLEGEDGTKGWIRIVQYCFPSEESDPFELFDGLNMAD